MDHFTTDMKLIWQMAVKRASLDDIIRREIAAIRLLDVQSITAQSLLHELAWAIYGAGFNVNVLRQKFPALEEAFSNWDPEQIVQRGEAPVQEALKVIGHTGKANAVKTIALYLHSSGWDDVRGEIFRHIEWDDKGEPIFTQGLLDFLDKLPWIGQTLARFVVKNIGIGSIKDDVMIKRLALHLGYSDDFAGVMKMAKAFQAISGESLSVIDTVLWAWVREQSWLKP